MDTAAKEQKLQATLADLHKRFGSNAVRQGIVRQNSTSLSTGFPKLDALVGGIPFGRVTELVGSPTSGMTTLALSVITTAQKSGAGVLYFDLARAFDPAYAAFCGVNLSELMLIRDDFETCIDILTDSLQTGIPGLLVFNTIPKLKSTEQTQLANALNRLQPSLPNTRCGLLILTLATPYPSRISSYVTLRLRTAFDRWLGSDYETYGYQAVVTVLKGKHGIEGKSTAIQITFDDKTLGAYP